jgi:hypothetical protein
MTPTFSDDEYHRLMMLTYLGEWVMNAIRKDPDPAYLDTASKVYSYAKGTPLEKLVTFDAGDESWGVSKILEDDAHAIIDQYDDKTFWEELTARMTERDLIASRGERAVRGMRPDQRARAASAIAKAYTKEFEEHGLERLKI